MSFCLTSPFMSSVARSEADLSALYFLVGYLASGANEWPERTEKWPLVELRNRTAKKE